jgi:hypothetical protein
MEVLIGVDPHKATNVVAVLSEQEELLDYATFCTNTSGVRSPLARMWWTCPPNFRPASGCSRSATSVRMSRAGCSLRCHGRLAQREAHRGER